ncbi:universal stress protein [Flavobacteriaceae bacterium SZ-1-7]|uniref:universal stress protein n=1 Tax=Tamlana sedimenti TaxID=3134126 RepID=UPI0031241232
MKNILLPTDFSKNSIGAINYAMQLLKDEACHFYILNVQKASSFITDDLMVVNSSATVYKTLIDASKKSMENIVLSIKKKFKNSKHEFHTIVDYDNFVDSINQVCSNQDIDLIIMGTHGASGLEKVFFGSNTAHVMQRSKTPVLAIPHGYKFTKLDAIAFTTSNLTFFKIKDLMALKYLVKYHRAKLNILHVADEQSAQNQALNEGFFQVYFNDANNELVNLNGKDVFDVIHDYIKNHDIKMLAMMNKKHSFLERLFTRHPVETFAFKIDIPLLVMHKNN